MLNRLVVGGLCRIHVELTLFVSSSLVVCFDFCTAVPSAGKKLKYVGDCHKMLKGVGSRKSFRVTLACVHTYI